MKSRYYVVDAFTDQVFGGNPAGVCILEQEIDAAVMQSIAAENNLAETAFVIEQGDCYGLRWFTPTVEIDLCGHATLASAFILSELIHPGQNKMRFETLSGILSVEKNGDLFRMDFPARMPEPVAVTPLMQQALGVPVVEAHASRDLMLVVEDERSVRDMQPDQALLRRLDDWFAVIVTAKGNSVDFVSRFFAPGAGIAEDPVTGSSHSTLIPFWSKRLQKGSMEARQLSARGGTLYCEQAGERVLISGKAVLYLEGCITF